MNYIYNATTKIYTNISTFDSAGVVKGDPISVLLLADLDQIFNSAKKRTSIKGRFAVDKVGGSALEQIALTDDERDWFNEIIKNGGTEIFKKLSAWTKGINSAYRHNVKFGNPVNSGAITSGGTTAVLTDSSKNLAVNSLAGKTLIITSPGSQMNSVRVIVSNTATAITVQSAFGTDVTGNDYAICDTVSDFIAYYLNLDLSWDLNLFLGLSASIEEAFIRFTLKEWYRINQNTINDYQLEEAAYFDQVTKIKSQLLSYKIPARRVTDFFQ